MWLLSGKFAAIWVAFSLVETNWSHFICLLESLCNCTFWEIWNSFNILPRLVCFMWIELSMDLTRQWFVMVIYAWYMIVHAKCMLRSTGFLKVMDWWHISVFPLGFCGTVEVGLGVVLHACFLQILQWFINAISLE